MILAIRAWLQAFFGTAYAFSPDYRAEWLRLTWTHPETGVVIYGEDMPTELKPEGSVL
jgi:hypothetical protein